MNGLNRHISIPKTFNLRNSLRKEKESSTSKTKNDSSSSEGENSEYIPIIRTMDNATILSKYTAILSRTSEDAITMEELDGLQQDLEKLLSTCATRNRYLRSEVVSLDKEEKRDKKKLLDKAPMKRKRIEEKVKQKEARNGSRLIKKHGLNVNNYIEAPVRQQELPKLTIPKNDTSEKFWASVEPFCAELQKEDVLFLDSLIENCSKEINVKIPEVGEHYVHEWANELYGDDSSVPIKAPRKGVNPENKKNFINALLETFSNQKTQSLLIEERISNLPAVPPTSPHIFNHKLKNKSVGCVEKRLKKELLEQGIINREDYHRSSPDDEVLQEVKKVQQELTIVNDQNVRELKKLKEIVAKDMHRQEVKEALDRCDQQIMELYSKVIETKQKALSNEDKDIDKNDLNVQITEDFADEADRLIDKQFILNKELLDLTDLSTFFYE